MSRESLAGGAKLQAERLGESRSTAGLRSHLQTSWPAVSPSRGTCCHGALRPTMTPRSGAPCLSALGFKKGIKFCSPFKERDVNTCRAFLEAADCSPCSALHDSRPYPMQNTFPLCKGPPKSPSITAQSPEFPHLRQVQVWMKFLRCSSSSQMWFCS